MAIFVYRRVLHLYIYIFFEYCIAFIYIYIYVFFIFICARAIYFLLEITFEVQKMYLTFMADLLGDVASALGPPCEIATAASVLSSFQEGRFLSGGSSRWGREMEFLR